MRFEPRIDSPVTQAGLKWVGGTVKFLPEDNTGGSEYYAQFIDFSNVILSMFVRFPKLLISQPTAFTLRVLYRSGGYTNGNFSEIVRSQRILWQWATPDDRINNQLSIVGVTLPSAVYDMGESLPIRSVDLLVESEAIANNHDYVIFNPGQCYLELR
jgi:hypothetical protein